MTYVVTKIIKGNPYLYEVKSVRVGDRVVQQFVRYLGRADKSGREELGVESVERKERIRRPSVAAVSEAVTPTVAVEAETPAPTAVEITPTPVTKEPWEMTKAERATYIEQRGKEAIQKWNESGSKGFPPSNPERWGVSEVNKAADELGMPWGEGRVAIPQHKYEVMVALKQGKPIPTEVLKDYPELSPEPTPEVMITPIEPEITPINPYMNMPIERVRRDASHGVKLAKEALAVREAVTTEVIPVTPEVTTIIPKLSKKASFVVMSPDISQEKIDFANNLFIERATKANEGAPLVIQKKTIDLYPAQSMARMEFAEGSREIPKGGARGWKLDEQAQSQLDELWAKYEAQVAIPKAEAEAEVVTPAPEVTIVETSIEKVKMRIDPNNEQFKRFPDDDAFFDKETREIVFRDAAAARNKETVNHELAHVWLDSKITNEGNDFLADYAELIGETKYANAIRRSPGTTAKESSESWNSIHESMARDFATFYQNPDALNPEIHAYLGKIVPKAEVVTPTAPAEEPKPEEVTPKGSETERGAKYYLGEKATVKPLHEAMLKFAPQLEDDYKEYVTATFKRMQDDLGIGLKGVHNSAKWAMTWRAINNNFKRDTPPNVYAFKEIEQYPYSVNTERLNQNAKQYGKDTSLAWYNKMQEKLGDLEGLEVSEPDQSGYIAITGKRGEDKIALNQQRIFNVSSRGLLFHQFPSRIYVNDEFKSEAEYQGEQKIPKVEKPKRPKIDPNTRPRAFYFSYITQLNDGRQFKENDSAKGMTEEEAWKKIEGKETRFGNKVVEHNVDRIRTWNDTLIWTSSSGKPMPKDGIIKEEGAEPMAKEALAVREAVTPEVTKLPPINESYYNQLEPDTRALVDRLRATAEPTMPIAGQPYKRTLWRGVRSSGSTDEGMFGKGTYYTTDPDVAKNYSEAFVGGKVEQVGKVFEQNVELKNPYVAHGGEIQQLGQETFSKALKEGGGYKVAQEESSKAIRQTLESQGYDGIVMPIKNAQTGLIHSEVVVFYPEKSAIPKAEAAPVAPEVTEEEGVIYHGSPVDFGTFDIGKQKILNEISGRGLSFTEDPNLAKQYALGTDADIRMARYTPVRESGFIYKVKLSKPLFDVTIDDPTVIEKVFTGARESLYKEELAEWNKSIPQTTQELYDNLLKHFGDSTNEVLKDLGFAGLKESANEIRVFAPEFIREQVKMPVRQTSTIPKAEASMPKTEVKPEAKTVAEPLPIEPTISELVVKEPEIEEPTARQD